MGLTSDEVAEAESNGNVKGDPANKYCRIRKRPLMVVHVVSVPENMEGIELEDYCVSLSFCMPTSRQIAREQSYQVNPVFRQSMLDPYESEVEEDEEKMMEAG